MSTEGFPGELPEQDPAQQYDFDHVLQTTGLSPEDLSQEVRFGSYQGTVASMLADEKCPVGGMIAKAYRNGGIDGVQQQFGMLSMMDSDFKVEVSERTLAYHRDEVSREDLLAGARQVQPDFLAYDGLKHQTKSRQQ